MLSINPTIRKPGGGNNFFFGLLRSLLWQPSVVREDTGVAVPLAFPKTSRRLTQVCFEEKKRWNTVIELDATC